MRLPKERRASARASSSLSPSSRKRATSSCTWASISEVKSPSLRFRPNMALAFRALRPENSHDGPCQALPLIGFLDESFAAGVFRALERGTKGHVLDELLFARRILDGARDPLSVLRSKNQRAEDHKVRCALQQFQSFSCVLG